MQNCKELSKKWPALLHHIQNGFCGNCVCVPDLHADCRGRWRSDTKQARTRGINQRRGKSKGLCKSSEGQGNKQNNEVQAIGIGHSCICIQLLLTASPHIPSPPFLPQHHHHLPFNTSPSSPLPLPCSSPHILSQFPLWISSCMQRGTAIPPPPMLNMMVNCLLPCLAPPRN